MPNNGSIFKGTIRGRIVELERSPGLPDGAQVSVTLQPAMSSKKNLRDAFGAWADASDELDRFLADIRRDRKQHRSDPAA